MKKSMKKEKKSPIMEKHMKAEKKDEKKMKKGCK